MLYKEQNKRYSTDGRWINEYYIESAIDSMNQHITTTRIVDSIFKILWHKLPLCTVACNKITLHKDVRSFQCWKWTKLMLRSSSWKVIWHNFVYTFRFFKYNYYSKCYHFFIYEEQNLVNNTGSAPFET